MFSCGIGALIKVRCVGMNAEKPKRGRGKGCLVALLVAGVLVAWSVWVIRAPVRRARAVRELITTGKSLEYIENVMKEKAYRYYVFYEARTNENWRSVKRDEFVRLVKLQVESPAPQVRVRLMFIGTAPMRVWFFVELDKTGGVATVSPLAGGD